MLEYMKWDKAAVMITESVEKTIQKKTVTYDLHRLMKGARKLSTSAYATQIIKNMR